MNTQVKNSLAYEVHHPVPVSRPRATPPPGPSKYLALDLSGGFNADHRPSAFKISPSLSRSQTLPGEDTSHDDDTQSPSQSNEAQNTAQGENLRPSEDDAPSGTFVMLEGNATPDVDASATETFNIPIPMIVSEQDIAEEDDDNPPPKAVPKAKLRAPQYEDEPHEDTQSTPSKSQASKSQVSPRTGAEHQRKSHSQPVIMSENFDTHEGENPPPTKAQSQSQMQPPRNLRPLNHHASLPLQHTVPQLAFPRSQSNVHSPNQPRQPFGVVYQPGLARADSSPVSRISPASFISSVQSSPQFQPVPMAPMIPGLRHPMYAMQYQMPRQPSLQSYGGSFVYPGRAPSFSSQGRQTPTQQPRNHELAGPSKVSAECNEQRALRSHKHILRRPEPETSSDIIKELFTMSSKFCDVTETIGWHSVPVWTSVPSGNAIVLHLLWPRSLANKTFTFSQNHQRAALITFGPGGTTCFDRNTHTLKLANVSSSVSVDHCRLAVWKESGRIKATLEDLGSSQGTYIIRRLPCRDMDEGPWIEQEVTQATSLDGVSLIRLGSEILIGLASPIVKDLADLILHSLDEVDDEDAVTSTDDPNNPRQSTASRPSKLPDDQTAAKWLQNGWYCPEAPTSWVKDATAAQQAEPARPKITPMEVAARQKTLKKSETAIFKEKQRHRLGLFLWLQLVLIGAVGMLQLGVAGVLAAYSCEITHLGAVGASGIFHLLVAILGAWEAKVGKIGSSGCSSTLRQMFQLIFIVLMVLSSLLGILVLALANDDECQKTPRLCGLAVLGVGVLLWMEVVFAFGCGMVHFVKHEHKKQQSMRWAGSGKW